jgi:cytochrome c-type biogenesis protein CcmF
MPWLAGTALLHSSVVLEKRDSLKAWTVLLAIITFSLSLLGTFLVRSGVLTSVHSFASDPARGAFILLLLTLVVGGGLTLFALRAASLSGGGLFAPISREGSLLLNNVLMSTAAATVLLGTLYPLFADLLNLGKISVGPPFFNIVFLPLMVPMVLAMACGPLLSWKRGDLAGVLSRLKFAFLAAIIIAAASWLAAGGTAGPLWAAGGIALSVWLLAGTLVEWAERVALFRVKPRVSLHRALSLPRAAYGMTLAHAGLAVIIAGITGSTAWKTEKIQVMHIGETVGVASYQLTLDRVDENVKGPNYTATRASFTLRRHDQVIALMQPEKREYTQPPRPTTSAAIHTNFLGDVYAVIGDPSGDGGYVTRLYYNPLVPWIFLGAGILVLGGIVSLTDRRHRIGAPVRSARAGAMARA